MSGCAEHSEDIMELTKGEACIEGLCRQYAPLIHMLARRIGSNAFLIEDLMQAGYIGLIRAATHYDARRNVRLITYAVPWILGEMKRVMRESFDDDGSFTVRKRLQMVIERLEAECGRAPCISELSAEIHLPAETIAMLLGRSEGRVSLEAMCIDTEAAPCRDENEHLDLKAAVRMLDPLEQRVIFLRFMKEKTQRETALLLDKTQSCISKAERRALLRMRAILQGDQNNSHAKAAQSKPRRNDNKTK